MAKAKYYQRPDGLYEASRKIGGKRVVFRGRSCREVDRKILEYTEEKELGRPFPVVADEWEREHETQVRESTRVAYRRVVQHLKAYWTGPIGQIRPLDVKRYVNAIEKQGYAASTVSTELCAIKQIFAHAVLAGDIDVSPAAEVRKSRGLPVKKREALTAEQEEIVKRSGREQTAPFWLFPVLLLYTGLRRSEALALNYNDVDRKAGVIHIVKKLSYAYGDTPRVEDFLKSANGKRDVPLLRPLAAVLPKDRIGPIFPGRDGRYLHKTACDRLWRKYCLTVGLTEKVEYDDGRTEERVAVTPHCLRHSYATMCYEAGMDARQAAGLLGDTPEVLEGVYTHLREERKRSAAEILEAHLDCVKTV